MITESLWQSSDNDSVINPPFLRFASQHWIIQLYHIPWAQTAASRASSEGQEHVLQPKGSQSPWFSPYSALRAISRFSPCCFVSKQRVWTAQSAANKHQINFPFPLWAPGFHCRLPAQALLYPWEHTGPWSFSSPRMAMAAAALGNLQRNPAELYRIW